MHLSDSPYWCRFSFSYYLSLAFVCLNPSQICCRGHLSAGALLQIFVSTRRLDLTLDFHFLTGTAGGSQRFGNQYLQEQAGAYM